MWLAGSIYFVIVFVFAFAFGAVRTLALEPRLGETAAVAIETPLLIGVIYFAARWVTQRMPLRPPALIGAGLFALLLQQVAEYTMVIAGGESVAAFVARYATPPGIMFALTLILYTIMPWLVGRKASE